MRPDIAIPPRIAALPREERGYPVPFFAAVINGKPDLRVADADKQLRCAKERVCWICGEKLGKFASFIGGPLSAKHGAFSDGPMHRECAEFSLRVCPHLAIPSANRRDTNIPETAVTPGNHVEEKPDKFIHYVTQKWEPVVVRAPQATLQFAAPTYVEAIWWKDGKPMDPQPTSPRK